jgi:thioredoxin reductase (NADPH)
MQALTGTMTEGVDVSATGQAPQPETPDLHGAFPRLDQEQLEALAARGERRPTQAGDVLLPGR